MRPDWLPADARIAMLGAAGWFGSNAQVLLDRDASILRTASYARDGYIVWDEAILKDFRPTIVMNFAFVGREQEAVIGTELYRRTNEKLTQQLLRTVELPSVRTALTISSGAALTMADTTYGQQKKYEADAMLALDTSTRTTVVGRAYSMSGPLIRHPSLYAFPDFVQQAGKGEVTIKADRPILRRYTSVREYIEVCLRSALQGASGVIESGGELIELNGLADRIVAIVNPEASIIRTAHTSEVPSIYASDNRSWMAACARHGITPSDVDAQIRAAAQMHK